MTRRGKLVLVVAPSGSGKDTLMEAAEAAFPHLKTLVTCTTREPRRGEVQDVDYHFLTREVFQKKIEQGEFLEWAEYGGNVYGTLKASIEEVVSRGELLLATIEVQGARRVRELLPPSELVTIYIDAGGWDVLARRIQSRAQMSPEELAKRYERYLDEVTFKDEAEYIVKNPDGGREEAAEQFVNVIADIKSTLA